MSWFNEKGAEEDIVLSSRIRFARNIKDYPFASRMDETSAREIAEKTTSALNGLGYDAIDFEKLSPVEARAYMERHEVSPGFLESKLPHTLLSNPEKQIYIMVCEEDHIRLQCIKRGLALEEAYKCACEADDILSEKLNYAWDEQFGYLTHCPTNLGTGMRASIMVFLPALTEYNMIPKLASAMNKIGLTIRGMYGEGTGAEGSIYQISNQITLGISEEETINKINDIIKQIMKLERQQRSVMKSDNGDRLTDRVCRALGTMKSAYMMSSSEFMRLYSDVKLGACMGLLPDVSPSAPDELMVEIQPASLMLSSKTAGDEHSRDIARAALIKQKL